jgi:MFS family permease
MPKWLPFSRADLRDPGQRNVLFVSLSQGASAVSFTFVDTFTPFYIFKVSPYSQRETLFWVGAIMGVIGLFLMVTAPMWGALTHRFIPKRLFQRAQLANGLVFLCMGFTMDLRLIFALKLLQGVFGGVSTIGLILVSSSSSKERLGVNVGLFQSCLTLGQLAGPPLGTLAAATFGYRGAFICGFLLVSAAVLLCQFKVTDVPKLPRPPKPVTKQPFDKRVLAGWMVCVMAQIQLIFLPSILPKVLETFNMHGAFALKIAGVVVMFYTAAAAFGSFSLTRFTGKMGLVRLITLLLVMSAIFQALLSFTSGVFGFTFVRMLQTGFAAAVIPLVFSIFASQKRGAVIGFINSSRFGGSAAGPMLAASVLAVSNLHTLFFIISGLTILALISFRLIFKSD